MLNNTCAAFGDIPVLLVAALNDIVVEFEASKSFGNNLSNCELFEAHDSHMWDVKHYQVLIDICHDFFFKHETKNNYFNKSNEKILSGL